MVREHLETFLAQAREASPEGSGLPRYVEKEFRRYLDCGVLEKGFALFECDKCGARRAVAFSCKTRSFCPSCLGRRMHEVASDLVERVLPVVAYRHWVLSLPVGLRFWAARDERVMGKLRAIFMRSVGAWQRGRARKQGIRGARTGAVVFTQDRKSVV